MSPLKGKPFFHIHPEFPEGKKWIIEVYSHTEELQGIVICGNKAELIHALNESIKEDDTFDINFEKN